MTPYFKNLSLFKCIGAALLCVYAGASGADLLASPAVMKYLLVAAVILLLLDFAAYRVKTRARDLPPPPSLPAEIGTPEQKVAPPPRISERKRTTRLQLQYGKTEAEILENLDSELRVARQIQFSLVPGAFPPYSEWREFDLYSALRPVREIGGDYYDFFMLNSSCLAFAVGDVSGKGVPAALYMAVCRTAFRTLAQDIRDPGELMTRLNEMLVRDNQSGLYITIACFFVDLPSGNCRYVLAGHPPPLQIRHATGRTDFLDTPRETFIGLKSGVIFPVGDTTLRPGDSLLLYSDGVPETRNVSGEELGYEGLRSRLIALAGVDSCREVVDGLEQSVIGFRGAREQQDDLTLMAFRYWGPGGQRLRKLQQKKDSRHGQDSARR